jgi:hypothetical protein
MSYRYDMYQIPPALLGFLCLISVLMIVCQWKIYVKAGQPGWASIVPIYNIIVLIKICRKEPIWLLYILIPIVNIYFLVSLINSLSKAFGKTEGFTAGLIFLGFIFYPILAFGDATYQWSGNNDQPGAPIDQV